MLLTHNPLQHQQHQINQQQHQLDFSSTVKQLLSSDGLAGGTGLVQSSEAPSAPSGFPGDMRLASELSSSISDLNTLDANLLFNPSSQQGAYGDSTPEELMNDPLFQQICNETANANGFDWLESKDQPTVGLMG